MKTDQLNKEVIRGGDLKETAFGIRPEDTHTILSILRDSMYSDKILAVIREYSTNAVDAHVDAGKDNVPIEVTLPTRLDPNLKIRDFGEGLSEDDIREIYAMYGCSTKRNTNKAVGQLGLGCKSGFAYGDQFMITSWHKGKKIVYSAYIDETNIGAIAKMSEEDSKEPDGVEIQVAAASEDVHRFHQKAAHLFSHFPIKPIVHNLNPDYGVIKDFAYWLEGELPNGVKWGPQEKNATPRAIMGGIPYDIDRSQFDFGERGEYILDHGIHIWFRIGDVQMAANREALEYNEKTKKHIKLVVRDVIDKIADAATEKLSGAKTMKEACIAFNRLTKESIFKHFAAQSTAKWNGRDVDGEILVLRPKDQRPKRNTYLSAPPAPITDPLFEIREVFLTKKWQGNSKGWSLSDTAVEFVKPFEDTVLIEADSKTKWRMKIEFMLSELPHDAYADKRGKGYYVISFKDDAARTQAFKDWNLDEWSMPKISEMPEPPDDFQPLDGPTMSKKEKKKHNKKVFQLKDDYAKHPERKSDNWEIVDIDINDDAQTRFYIKIDHFFPSLWGSRRTYPDIAFLMDQVPKFGVKVDKLYGLKPPIVEKVKDLDHWIALDTFAEVEALKQKPVLLRLIARDESLRAAPDSLKPYSVHTSKFPKGCPMRELLEFYTNLRQQQTSQEVDKKIVKLLLRAGHNLKREAAEELDRLLEAVRKRYPLLAEFRIFPDGYHHSIARGQLKAVIQYVEIIERDMALEVEEDDF